VKVTKNLKESKNIRKELLNSYLEVSQSVSAATYKGFMKNVEIQIYDFSI